MNASLPPFGGNSLDKNNDNNININKNYYGPGTILSSSDLLTYWILVTERDYYNAHFTRQKTRSESHKQSQA